MSRHLTTDELIDYVYGLNRSAHLGECDECASRWQAMRTARHAAIAPDEPSSEFWAKQRREIYQRIDQPRRRLRWLPAAAAAGALAIVGLIWKPPAPPAVHPDPGDTQLFSEVYSMEQSIEPQAAAPIHELFEGGDQ
jgi:anti-sigma factor RsiW